MEKVFLTGRVKWFNNKAGYGFLTITDGDKSGTDVFVHHSAIVVMLQQYKYLVQGEYVQFELANTNSVSHEFQACSVIGVNGGKLMCETRNEVKESRKSYTSKVDSDSVVAESDSVVAEVINKDKDKEVINKSVAKRGRPRKTSSV